jgi:DNA-binding transcriptional MerR regulator
MTTAALDTLRIAKRLRDAGFSEAQAESVTDAVREAADSQDLVTKAQLDAALGSLKAELKADLKAEIADAKSEIIKWMFGAMLAQGALVVTLIKLFPGK